TVRVGLSYTSAAGAADNLAAEAPPSLSFDAIRAAATQTWNEHLHDVVVTGGSTATTETFYTNLYRALLMPSVLNDDDGSYLGLDGQVHQVAVGHEHYTNLSLWDIYRSQVPLIDLVEPAVAQDIATSLLADYDQNHEQFPRWVYANFDLGTMGGDSAMEVLATDLADGVLSGQEASTAYADLVHATTPPASSGNLGVYLDNGYIPFAGASDNRPSSETLSYAIGYGALAQVAQIYGTPAQVQQFSSLSGYWKNLFDPSDRFLRPRNSDGSWANPTSVGPESIFSPDSQDGWQEGTGWQYLWSVPQDVAGLTQAIGGRDATLSRLDRFFSTALQTGTAPLPVAQVYDNEGGIYYVGDQYTASNEPDLWSPYYYDWLGQPWKTAKVVHSEMQTYNASPDGLPGNDDAGEMSAWYVLSALGIYQVTPGTPSWELTTPTFPLETIRLGSRVVRDQCARDIAGCPVRAVGTARRFAVAADVDLGR
ncbi:MAG: glycoside hydrolase family 92 protein, partial [Acidimicrobiales bacterium]